MPTPALSHPLGGGGEGGGGGGGGGGDGASGPAAGVPGLAPLTPATRRTALTIVADLTRGVRDRNLDMISQALSNFGALGWYTSRGKAPPSVVDVVDLLGWVRLTVGSVSRMVLEELETRGDKSEIAARAGSVIRETMVLTQLLGVFRLTSPEEVLSHSSQLVAAIMFSLTRAARAIYAGDEPREPGCLRVTLRGTTPFRGLVCEFVPLARVPESMHRWWPQWRTDPVQRKLAEALGSKMRRANPRHAWVAMPHFPCFIRSDGQPIARLGGICVLRQEYYDLLSAPGLDGPWHFAEACQGNLARRPSTGATIRAQRLVDGHWRVCSSCRTWVEHRRVCAGCHYHVYCSKECQRAAWRQGHRENCGDVRRVLAEETQRFASLRIQVLGAVGARRETAGLAPTVRWADAGPTVSWANADRRC